MRVEPAHRWPVFVSVSALILFVGLVTLIASGDASSFDLAIRSSVHQTASALVTRLAFALSAVGELVVLSAISLAIGLGLFLLGERRSAVALVAALGGVVVINDWMKVLVHRARPHPFFGVAPQSLSFPSGHAAFSASVFGALSLLIALYMQRVVSRAAVMLSAAILVCGIGWSRIYLGVHFPTDVIGGLLVAIFWLGVLGSIGLFSRQRH